MKQAFRKIVSLLGSRVAQNIYFWIFIIYQRVDGDISRLEVLFTIILFAILAVLAYINNLVLIPRYLSQRKYWFYLLFVVPVIAVTACCYLLALKLMLHYFPQLTPGSVSIFVNEVSREITAGAMLHEAGNYIAFMILWTAFFTMAWYIRDYSRQQKIMDAVKKKQVETELSFLKGQINPHFLFNTLNNLYGLAIKKSETTPDAILKLSSILRYLLYESNVDKISFEKEKEIMQAYIDLELLRLTNKDNLSFSITADGDYQLPPLLWIPVLENVFKYGTRFIADSYFIEYRFSITNNLLTIYAANSYKPTTEQQTNGGIGLLNLRKRLELLYPGKYEIATTDENNFFTINIKVKLS